MFAIRLSAADQHANLRSIFVHSEGTRRIASRSLMRHWFGGDENGTRNFALAAGCAYPDHHPAVAVLRPLSGKEDRRISLDQAPSAAEPDLFFAQAVSLAFALKNPL
jgi:hypothetical protein